jgi:hypothetical protein
MGNTIANARPSDENTIVIGALFTYWARSACATLPVGEWYWPREVFIVENVLSHDSDTTPPYVIEHTAWKSAVMGNTLTGHGFGTSRFFLYNRTFIGHNRFGGGPGGGGYPLVKSQALGLNDLTENLTAGVRTAVRGGKTVIADNLFGSAGNNLVAGMGVAPQNSQSAEGIEDVILERNTITRAPVWNQDFDLAGRRLTTRATTISGGATPNVRTGAPNDGSLPAEWRGPYYVEDRTITPVVPSQGPAPEVPLAPILLE